MTASTLAEPKSRLRLPQPAPLDPSSSIHIHLAVEQLYFVTMAHEFEPLTNDLILRTARGITTTITTTTTALHFPGVPTDLDCLAGENVERTPIWIMRQGKSPAVWLLPFPLRLTTVVG